MTSSRHGLYELGYTCATMVITKRCNSVKLKLIYKRYLSPDYSLQLESMKSKSLVIVDQHATVKLSTDFVHTARHALEIDSRRSMFIL
jgi:hypothetical protein